MVLPSNADTGTVIGTFIDGAGNAVTGTVNFTPSVQGLRDPTASPKPVTILPKPVPATLDSGGTISQVLLSNQDPDLIPSGTWNWMVSFEFADGLHLDPFPIDVPVGGTVDLGLVAPSATPTGEVVVYGTPVGGTTGQILGKLSDDDGDIGWVDPPSGSVTSVNDVTPVSGDVSLDADDIPDGSSKVLMTPAERTKLSGVAANATANDTDANLKNRANHTGLQSSSTISDFTEAVQDAVAALLTSGTQVSLSYNDAGNALTISATGADAETMRDTIGAALVGVGNITVTVNDAGDTITISTTATQNSTDAQLRDRSTHTGTQAISTIAGLQAALDVFTKGVGGIVIAVWNATVSGWRQWDGDSWDGALDTSASKIRFYVSIATVGVTPPTYYNSNDMWFANPAEA